jgi:hypothetical protein
VAPSLSEGPKYLCATLKEKNILNRFESRALKVREYVHAQLLRSANARRATAAGFDLIDQKIDRFTTPQNFNLLAFEPLPAIDLCRLSSIHGGDVMKCAVRDGEMGPCLWIPADAVKYD